MLFLSHLILDSSLILVAFLCAISIWLWMIVLVVQWFSRIHTFFAQYSNLPPVQDLHPSSYHHTKPLAQHRIRPLATKLNVQAILWFQFVQYLIAQCTQGSHQRVLKQILLRLIWLVLLNLHSLINLSFYQELYQ